MKFMTVIPGLTLFQGLGGQPAWAEQITSDEIVEIARSADELGYDYLPLPWHLVIGRGEPAKNFGSRWPHPIPAAGFLLGATKRIVTMPYVVVPCELPVSIAKSIATLDWMSGGGRVIPVLLTGYLQPEFDVLRVPFAERGAIMDEYVDAMLELWSSSEPEFNGRYVSFSDVVVEPRPRQQPLPIWFGGRTKSALRRIARDGSGWMSYATPHAEMHDAVEYIRAQPEFAASPRPLEIGAYFVEATHDPVTHEEKGEYRPIVGKDAVLEQLRYLASIGVNVTRAPLDARPGKDGKPLTIESSDDYIEHLAWFAEEIMPEARALAPAVEQPVV
jgi:alkanesulfonate monooxygenase SsuD/methylene tetrahydromethanopterin reductase-like flavin-dependent oxidoreductase (luciferase family)